MNHVRFPALVLFFLTATLFLLACGSPAAAPVPATVIPTVLPPTSAPTSVPPTGAPTATSAPTKTPLAASNGGNMDQLVADAFAKFAKVDTFHLQAHSEVSTVFFQGQYTPLPGEDPDLITLFTIDGEQKGADLHYALTGFIASFIGVFTGFDPNSAEIEILNVDGAQYMRGKLEGETTARWYKIPDDQLASSNFSPQEMVSPMTTHTYPSGSFSKTGNETVGTQTCSVLSGNRAAFDVVFPGVVQDSLMDPDKIDLAGIERTEFTVTLCPDGDIYRIAYNFDAHTQENSADKGKFTFEAKFSDFGGNISIVPPADAIDMPSAANAQPTIEPQATPIPANTTSFTTLDGEWEGTSGDDSPLSFTVEDGAITYANINYAVSAGGCSTSGVIANSVDDGKIQNSTFSVVLTDSDNVQYTVTGKFESNNQAAGTFAVKGKTFCGDTDTKFDWTAQHISSPEVSATPEPTVEPTTAPTQAPPTQTPTVQPTRVPATPVSVPSTTTPTANSNGAQIIANAFAAFGARDLNRALVDVSDDVVFNIGGTTGVGKSALQSNMQLALTFGANFSVSNIRSVGDIVTFTVTVTGIRAGTYTNSSAIIQNGKITVFNIN